MFLDNALGPNREITWATQFWPVLFISFGVSLAGTWVCKRVAIKLNIVDRPDNLVKTHREPIAYLGGVGILVGLLFGLFAGVWSIQNDMAFRPALKLLLGIMAGAVIACFIGLVDDVVDIKPKHKILGQVVAATALLLAGIYPNLSSITSVFGFQLPGLVESLLGGLIVLAFVLGATNSLNLLDGLDGLCGGVTVIITLAMLALSVHLATWGFSEVGDPVRVIVCLGLVGAVAGFLPFNRHPAKIFMGDAGSMLLGFVVAALMILFAESAIRWWLASIVVFGLPILDTAVALVRRLLNHKPLFVSDRGHIYDQLMDRGLGLKKTVAVSYILASAYAIVGLLMSQVRTRYAVLVYAVVVIISAFVVWKKGYLRMEGIRGAVKDENSKAQSEL